MSAHKFLVIVAVALATTALAQEPLDAAAPPGPSQRFEQRLAEAGLPADDVAHLRQDMAAAGFSQAQLARIDQQFQQAQKAQIAQQAMIGKVREGLAKQVGPEAIVTAVSRVRERYTHALQMATSLARERPEALERTFAEAMSSGLKPQDADTIAHALQEQVQGNPANQQNLINQTMVTARDLVRMGVSSQLTTEIVQDALARNYDAADMKELRQTFDTRKNKADMNLTARQLGTAIHQGVEAGKLGSSLDQAGGMGARGSANQGANGTGGAGSSGNGGGGNAGGDGAGSNGGDGSGSGGGSGGGGGNGGGSGGDGGGSGGGGR